jgi:phosphoribosyl 1,2-cyclic phosphodiesterase
MASLQLTVLGSGTSMGVPTLGCHCGVCESADPLDKRMRPSVLLSYGGRNVVIDTTPDFRSQALRARMDRLDAVIYTHGHADHILGLDDIRPFNMKQKGVVPIYAASRHHRDAAAAVRLHLRRHAERQPAARRGTCTRSTDHSICFGLRSCRCRRCTDRSRCWDSGSANALT